MLLLVSSGLVFSQCNEEFGFAVGKLLQLTSDIQLRSAVCDLGIPVPPHKSITIFRGRCCCVVCCSRSPDSVDLYGGDTENLAWVAIPAGLNAALVTCMEVGRS